MLKQQTIKCAFCQGTGENPHFTGSCPVCKGRGKNQIRGKIATCRDCRGSGQKGGTTLTCFTCGGLGVVPDTAEIFKKAKKEIKEAREEMDKERRELREKTQPDSSKKPPKKQAKRKVGRKREAEETVNESEDPKGKIFCQSCANRVEKSSTVKICLECLKKIKEL